MLDYSKKKPVVFPYIPQAVKTRSSTETVYRPMALVALGKRKLQLNALIDTGSDKTISYLKPFGNALGIDIDDFEGEPDELRGLFQKDTAWVKHMDLWIGEHHFNIPIFWLTREYDKEKNYPLILGRKVIFNNFDVVFREKEKKVYFYYNK